MIENRRTRRWEEDEFIVFEGYCLVYEIINGTLVALLPGGKRINIAVLGLLGKLCPPKKIRRTQKVVYLDSRRE